MSFKNSPFSRIAFSKSALIAGALLLNGVASTSVGAQARQGIASDGTFGVSLFGDESESLWPIEVVAEIVSEDGKVVALPSQTLVTSDGKRLNFSHSFRTPQGQQRFDLTLVARHLVGERIELEYDLVVNEARFENLDWKAYALHRFNLGERPEVGRHEVATVRADIVSTESELFSDTITVGNENYELRLQARRLRG